MLVIHEPDSCVDIESKTCLVGHHRVRGAMSLPMCKSLDHSVRELGIGPIVAPNGILQGFNFEVEYHGGIQFGGTY